MATKNLHSVNASTSTAQLVLYDIAGIEITRYELAAGMVTLGARPTATTLTKVALMENVRDIVNWWKHIRLSINPTSVPRPSCSDEFEFDDSSVKAAFKYGAVPLTEAEHTDSGNQSTFGPRPLAVLTWAEFTAWKEFLVRFDRLAVPWLP